MTEHIRILTGSPATVQHALAAAMAEHPNTQILSSSTCVTHPLAETKSPPSRAKRGASPSPSSESPPPAPPTDTEPQPTYHLTVIIGRVFA
jgi:hypothetical protein